MPQTRSIEEVFIARETMEGAGVRLHRAFGHAQIPRFDPFLMFDDFRGDDPGDYLAGFPWHPHRGIETVTYMLEGRVEHGDSMGHAGSVPAGGIQWMTAGSGIIHQEMPKPVNGRMGGFQLWVNLPRSHKMMKPRYQEILATEIPLVTLPGGAAVRVICGTVGGVAGPVRDLMADPEYLDVTLEPGAAFSHQVAPGYMAGAYVFAGSGRFDPQRGEEHGNRRMILFGSAGDRVDVAAGDAGVRFLFFSGRPLREPIAWGGPIVMNTDAELRQAFAEYRDGTFIRS
ncbi:redox-sensitive bicupin YhaK (pirin superfamily) [Methanocalculus alkaliphilus]|uniref:pirin family protein n=1 Tax=Methanocalculus alkaliphilus TaxID=768730 RepID=UPI0020A222B0|nr:pirin family protein [Methanocalculus alkaliphilus]MCP1715870.1 redox-sensitive bicupin YhaK (pirin superfamily) [Methanocalculus alkaliphilus]